MIQLADVFKYEIAQRFKPNDVNICGVSLSGAVGPELLLMYSAYDPTNVVILISRIMVLICVIFSTPLLHYPVSIALVQNAFYWALVQKINDSYEQNLTLNLAK